MVKRNWTIGTTRFDNLLHDSV